MENASLRIRLFVMGGVILSGLLVVGSLGIYTSRLESAALDDVVSNRLVLIRNLTLIDMVHDGVRGAVFEARVGLADNDSKAVLGAQSALHEYQKDVAENFETISKLEVDTVTSGKIASAKKEMEKYFSVAQKLIDASKAGNLAQFNQGLITFRGQFDSLETVLGDLGESVEKSSAEYFTEVRTIAGRLNLLLTVSAVLALIVGLFMLIRTSTSLNKVLGFVTAELSTDAIEVREMVSRLESASASLSSSSTEQAAALQETAASIEEIAAMAKRSAENAVEARQLSTVAQDKARSGGQVVERMVAAIRNVDSRNEQFVTEVNEGNRKVSEIIQVIEEIGAKTKVINEIVFQTKLLSFNASVEAARAGEHGKGFAVVAEEVGNLAFMSGKSAKEISDLLGESVLRVQKIVDQSKSQVDLLAAGVRKTVEESVHVANECGEVLREIITQSESVSDRVQSIAVASEEQSNGVAEIAKALRQLDEATQINSVASESCAQTSSGLSGQVDALMEASAKLRRVVEGSQTVARTPGNDSSDIDEHKVEMDDSHRKAA